MECFRNYPKVSITHNLQKVCVSAVTLNKTTILSMSVFSVSKFVLFCVSFLILFFVVVFDRWRLPLVLIKYNTVFSNSKLFFCRLFVLESKHVKNRLERTRTRGSVCNYLKINSKEKSFSLLKFFFVCLIDFVPFQRAKSLIICI